MHNLLIYYTCKEYLHAYVPKDHEKNQIDI